MNKLKFRTAFEIYYLILDSSGLVVTDSTPPSCPPNSYLILSKSFASCSFSAVRSCLIQRFQRSCFNALLQLIFERKLVWPLGSFHLTWWQIFRWRGSFAICEILCLSFISQVLEMNALPTKEISWKFGTVKEGHLLRQLSNVLLEIGDSSASPTLLWTNV